jgi:CheY-like chemotaxis protein
VVASQPATQATPLALAGVSVLLVEDEDDTRHMLSTALENFGARVTAVCSVPAAFDALRDATPHVVVSDIGMPEEDGYSLIHRLRTGEIEQVRQVPAIALTAFARMEDRERILASGFAYHLSKPIDPMLVVRTVREAAGR